MVRSFLESLINADDPNASSCGVDNHIRGLPVELLEQFQSHGFFTLNTVRLLQGRGRRTSRNLSTALSDDLPGVH